MTVSIGQYIPGKSVLHRADPRTKILWTIIMMCLILTCQTFIQYGLVIILTLAAVICSHIRPKMLLKSLKAILFLLLFTLVFNLLFYKGTDVVYSFWKITIYREALIFSAKMILRVTMLVVSASLLTFTTSSVSITDGLESLMKPLAKIKFPVHEFAMMMSIALRFIPTFADEPDRIIKAQSSRGAEFDSKNIFKVIKSYVPVLVPLFIGAFKSAEDMATAMEARCYSGGEGRTKYKVLRYSRIDLIIAIITLLFIIALVLLKIFKV